MKTIVIYPEPPREPENESILWDAVEIAVYIAIGFIIGAAYAVKQKKRKSSEAEKD